jgi:hypothetical protein
MKTKSAILVGATLLAAAFISAPAMASGGTGGGGTNTCDLTPVLPGIAPFPDIIIRESFGPGPNNVRPAGGKGCNQPVFQKPYIGGYWSEFPGTKNSAWIAPPETTQTWRICSVSDNIYEMPSPLQTVYNGCITSPWFDHVLTRPTMLLPFTQPAGAYEMHLDMWLGLGDPTYYEAFGVTDSAVTDRNLESVGGIWFEIGNHTSLTDPVLYMTYNVHVNGRTGPILATGVIPWSAWLPVNLRYNPATGNASASVNGIELGTFYAGAIKAPKYVGIEGVGNADDLVVRNIPAF